jgi:hypothetical protein
VAKSRNAEVNIPPRIVKGNVLWFGMDWGFSVQVSLFGFQGSGQMEVSVFRFRLSCFFFLTPESSTLTPET